MIVYRYEGHGVRSSEFLIDPISGISPGYLDTRYRDFADIGYYVPDFGTFLMSQYRVFPDIGSYGPYTSMMSRPNQS